MRESGPRERTGKRLIAPAEQRISDDEAIKKEAYYIAERSAEVAAKSSIQLKLDFTDD